MPFDLVIWDCDGCLIDSEYLSCWSAADLLTAEGYAISAERFVDRFLGWRWTDIYRVLREETGIDYEAVLPYVQLDGERRKLFERELKPIPHVVEAMDAMALPVCIASGSEPERLEHSLKLTGLWDRFEGRVFSAHEVERGKPAPDIFLYAAQKMATQPERCLVVEDSTHGIAAAKAARMPVFAFTGGTHISPDGKDRLAASGPDALFHDMRDLPDLARRYGAQ